MNSKICTGCKIEKELKEFSPRKDGVLGKASRCILCRRNDRNEKYKSYDNPRRRNRWHEDESYRKISLKASKKYREKNKELLKKKMRDSRRKRREEVISRYGGICECCKENRYEFLAIDHKFGGGNKERKSLSVSKLVSKLHKNPNIDSNYRILCHNCNMAFGFYGECPHQRII